MAKALDIKSLFVRWRAGESMTALFAEATAAGFAGKKGKFRRAIQAVAGGKTVFTEMRAAGAGDKAEPFGGKRAASSGPKLDDSKVKHLTPKKGRLSGWTWRYVREPVPVKWEDDHGTHSGLVSQIAATVYISPKGNEYVKALGSEKADLIIRYRTKFGSPIGDKDVRFKRFTKSSIKRKIDQRDEQLERGEAALKRTRQAKREKKLARRKAEKSSRKRGGK